MENKLLIHVSFQGFNRTVGGRKTEWIKLGSLKAGAIPVGSGSGKEGAASTSLGTGSGGNECPPSLQDVEQSTRGCDGVSNESVSGESTHNLTLSDTLDDGSIRLREEGALFKDNSFLNLTDNSLPNLNSSILLSDKIELSFNNIEEEEDQYGDEETALVESLDAELDKVSEEVDTGSEMQVTHLKERSPAKLGKVEKCRMLIE